MNSIKIRFKFFILGMIAFLSLLFLGFLAFNINNTGFFNLTQVFNDFKKVQNLQVKYIEPLFILREQSLTLVMSPNENFKTNVDLKLQQELKKLDLSFEKSPKDIYKEWEDYKTLLLTTREYSLNGFDEGSFMNVISPERKQFARLIESLKLLQKDKLKDSKNRYENAESDMIYSRYYIILGFLFIGISSLIFDMTVIKKVVESIEELQRGLFDFFDYLSNPKKEKEQFINLETKDELGLMAKGINQQVKLIKNSLKKNKKVIEEATDTLHELKEGKSGKRVISDASNEELNKLKNVMNEMMNNLENKIQSEITTRTNQEKLLIQQSKLAAMGNMLGNIAHQWRQPISEINAVLMDVEAVARFDTLKMEYLFNHIKKCYGITEHMSSTISDFQNFFKPSKEKEFFDVYDVCLSAISIISASLKYYNIKLTFDINEKCKVYGYPREFAHAILNIISNSKDVLNERNIENKEIQINIKTGKKFVLIKIEDNAGGIKDENIDIIFEPYYTTKHASKGTGIGLYMTKMIIEDNMDGYVNVENTQKGALFTIKLKK